MKAINAVYLSSVFLKYLIENAQSDNFDELHLSLDGSEPIPKEFMLGNYFVTRYSTYPFNCSFLVCPSNETKRNDHESWLSWVAKLGDEVAALET